MSSPRLVLTREQILSFRLRVNALDRRLPADDASLREAAWAGLQDSMPRAALLSIHARVEQTMPDVLDNPALIQVWGPRYSVFVVAATDLGVFTLGRLSTDPTRRRRADDVAKRIESVLGDSRLPFGEVGKALGVNPNALRYAAPTGSILIDWDGARQPTMWRTNVPDADPREARLELVRRYLHIFGPGSADAFSKWAGVQRKESATAFAELAPEVVAVETPIGESWLLAADENVAASTPRLPEGVRLLPSGDAFYLLQGNERDILVRNAGRREQLWTSRVWPGAVLVNGEIAGTWRRSKNKFTMEPWGRLTAATKEAIEAEAAALPLPEDPSKFAVEWL